MGLNDYARALLAWPGFAPSPRQTAKLEVLTVGELGFADGATLEQLWQRVRELGLQLCPLDLAPAWRLVYLDQPEEVETARHKAPRGSITVLSPPPSDADEFPKGFYLRRMDGQLWLRGYTCGLDVVWQPDAVLAALISP